MAQKYTNRIRAVLKKNGKYNDGLGLLIESTAISMSTVALCRRELESLERSTVEVKTRYGLELKPHPVFRTLRDAQAILLKSCKELGLNYEEVTRIMEDEEDPYNTFMRNAESYGNT